MSVAERIGNWSLAHPTATLTIAGFCMGLTISNIATSGVVGIVLGGIICAFFTVTIAYMRPIEPSLGPQQ